MFLGRVFEALILASFAAMVAYGLTAWLAPPSVSAKLVAAVVGSITALGILAPSAILACTCRGATHDPDRRYFGYSASVSRDEG